ncbi:cytochrome P450 81E8 [Cajanus cajan]|uniref:cytochrome P450 81E8 n=1 Tax=Cajanus cajan TaxID=3821 RepID=UPI00098DB0AD|nr:cytochrome P450 81E8 [Cajanus cajan]
MTPFYFTLACMVLLLSLKFLIQTRRYKNLPPGPPSIPFIGNLHQLPKPFHRTFHAMSQKYGHVFSLRFGSRLVVVVSSHQAAQECFTKNDIVFANRPKFIAGKYINYNFTTMASSDYGDHWRNLRRIMTLEVLSTHRLNSFSDVRRDEAMRLVRKLAQRSRNGFAKVELKSMFSEMMFNTVLRMVSGKRYYGKDCEMSNVEEAKQFRELIEELFALVTPSNRGDFLPLVRLFDLDGFEKKLKSLSKRSDAFLQGLIDQHRNGKHSANTFIDYLLTQQRSQPEYYTDQIIKGIALNMIMAGTDTSAITLEWAMSNLLNHPEILKKAKNELDSHVGQNRLVDEDDISKLHYVQCIIYETLRLHPPGPLLLPHVSSKDCAIGEYDIPQNTILLVNTWTIHKDPKLWNDPTQFKPERFEKENEANKLLAFGLGRRSCPGENMAHRLMNLALALLIQCFEWKRINEEEIDMTEGKESMLKRKYALEAMCRVSQFMTIKDMF